MLRVREAWAEQLTIVGSMLRVEPVGLESERLQRLLVPAEAEAEAVEFLVGQQLQLLLLFLIQIFHIQNNFYTYQIYRFH